MKGTMIKVPLKNFLDSVIYTSYVSVICLILQPKQFKMIN